MRRLLATISALALGLASADAQTWQTPGENQQQINGLPWNGQKMLTGAQFQSLFTNINGTFQLYGSLAGPNNWTGSNAFTGSVTLPGAAVGGTAVTPVNGSLATALNTILGRIVSLDDASGIVLGTSGDTTAAAQGLINAVAVSGGGSVLVGPNQYPLNPTAIAAQQPTSATFNGAGFTLFIANADQHFIAGNAITLAGFSAPFTNLNGTWTISVVNSTNIVVLTSLSGSQAQSSTGMGSLIAPLSIPPNVKLICPKSLTAYPFIGKSWSQMPYTFLTSGYGQIVPAQNSGFFGCNLVNSAVASNVVNTATLRQNLTAAAAFAGTGISTLSSDVQLEDLAIVGYDVGVNSYYGARGRWTHLNIDANKCVIQDNSHDISEYVDIHCFPFAIGWNATAQGTITNVANNGSGLWRVSTTFANQVNVGDTVLIGRLVGAASANGVWSVAATNGSSYVDLAGTNATGTSSYTATTTFGSFCLKSATGTAGIGEGDAITGTNIPASTVVTDVLPRQSTICMSNAATNNATGVAITTTAAAYASGGLITLNANRRTGKAFSFTNGEENRCTNCFSFGHQTGFYLGVLSSWTHLTTLTTECGGYDRAETAIWIDSTAIGSDVNGGQTQGCWTPLLGTSTSTDTAHLIRGVVMNGYQKTAELGSGRYQIYGNSSSFATPGIFVGDGVSFLGYGMNDLKTTWEFQSATGQNAVSLSGNSFGSASAFQGATSFVGPTSLGGGSSCVLMIYCGVTINGQLIYGVGAGVYSAYQIPQQLTAWRFTGTVTGGAYTVTLPPATAGAKEEIIFDTAVATLSWAATTGSVAGAPTSASAGQLMECLASDNNIWHCK